MSGDGVYLPGAGMGVRRRGAHGEAARRVCVEYRTAMIILVVWIFLGSLVVWNAPTRRRPDEVHHFDEPDMRVGEAAAGEAARDAAHVAEMKKRAEASAAEARRAERELAEKRKRASEDAAAAQKAEEAAAAATAKKGEGDDATPAKKAEEEEDAAAAAAAKKAEEDAAAKKAEEEAAAAKKAEEEAAAAAAAKKAEEDAAAAKKAEEEAAAAAAAAAAATVSGVPLTTVECVEAVAADGPDNQLPRGTCRFHNVYFHGAIFYLLHADDAPLTYHDVRISTRHWKNTHFRNGEVHVRMLPVSRAGEIGLGTGDVPRVTRPVLPHSRLFPKNHGHMIIDTSIPLMWTLDLFHAYTADNQVVFIDGYGHAAYDDRIRMITTRDPIYINTGVTKHGKLGTSGDYKDFSSTALLCGESAPVCMLDTVVAGVGDLGFWFHADSPQMPVRAWEWRLFRDRAVRNLGLEAEVASFPPPARDDMEMLVVDRKDKKHIRNVDEVVARLQAEFPHASVRVEYMTGKSLAQQIVLMQRTSFMFAVEGTAVDNALFMQDNSGMLVLYPPDLGPEGGAGWWNQQYHHDHPIAAWNEYLTVESLRGRYNVDLDAMTAAAHRIVDAMLANRE